MRMRKKKWVRPFLNEEKIYLLDNIDDLKTDKPIYLEIGMGMGDFICEAAINNPDIFYIGLEKDETCVARAIIKATEMKIENLRIILINADFIEDFFQDRKVDFISLPFSDPWPKKAHHKRRLTYPTFLKKYRNILNEGGKLIMKTDNDDLFNDSLEYFALENWHIEECEQDYHRINRNEPMTGYEQKFVLRGLPIHYVKLSK